MTPSSSWRGQAVRFKFILCKSLSYLIPSLQAHGSSLMHTDRGVVLKDTWSFLRGLLLNELSAQNYGNAAVIRGAVLFANKIGSEASEFVWCSRGLRS